MCADYCACKRTSIHFLFPISMLMLGAHVLKTSSELFTRLIETRSEISNNPNHLSKCKISHKECQSNHFRWLGHHLPHWLSVSGSSRSVRREHSDPSKPAGLCGGWFLLLQGEVQAPLWNTHPLQVCLEIESRDQ